MEGRKEVSWYCWLLSQDIKTPNKHILTALGHEKLGTICLIFSSPAGSLCLSGWLHSALGTCLTLWVTELFINKGLASSHTEALCWATTSLNTSHVIRGENASPIPLGVYGLTPAGITGTKFSPILSTDGRPSVWF